VRASGSLLPNGRVGTRRKILRSQEERYETRTLRSFAPSGTDPSLSIEVPRFGWEWRDY